MKSSSRDKKPEIVNLTLEDLLERRLISSTDYIFQKAVQSMSGPTIWQVDKADLNKLDAEIAEKKRLKREKREAALTDREVIIRTSKKLTKRRSMKRA